MLRYVKLDPTTRTARSFCCGRVVFSEVNISVPDISLLFDNDYIEKTFKRYIRKKNEWTEILASNCGKCEGYGFYDWVTRLTGEDDEDPIYNRGVKKPLVVKNENPISVIYMVEMTYLTFYYVSDFKPDSMTYRCEQCLGTGLALHDHEMVPLTKDSLPQLKPEPKVLKSINKLNPVTIFIRRLLNGTVFHHKNNRQNV